MSVVTATVRRDLLRDLTIAGLLVALTAIVYLLVSGPAARRQSSAPHFVLLADALLHGRLWVDPARAAQLGDITPFAGHYYVSFPPMAALLMLPFVAVVGTRFNDALFTLLLGAGNAALAYALVRRLSRPGFASCGLALGRLEAIAVAATLAFGTVHFYASLMGRVWFTAHVVAVTFLLLYLLECAGRGRPLVAGAALAAAFLARTPAAFGALFWITLALRQSRNPRHLAWQVLQFGAAPALAAALLLVLNMARFGSPLDFGYEKMSVARQLEAGLRAHGLFSLHFLPRNLEALLLRPPLLDTRSLARWQGTVAVPSRLGRLLAMSERTRGFPFPVKFDPWGTGIWAVSPVLLFCLRPPPQDGLRAFGAAWLSALTIAGPNLLYYNTGWYQFGYRFALDFLPLLLVPLAMGLRRPLHSLWRSAFVFLLALSATTNLLGARWFLGLPPY